MEKIVTDMMTKIDNEMREQGCFLGVDELFELAINELSAREDDPRGPSPIEIPWQ